MNATEKSATRWFFHVAQAVCITVGISIVVLFLRALPHLQQELSKPQYSLVGFLFLTVMFLWAILSVLIMILLDPRRRAA